MEKSLTITKKDNGYVLDDRTNWSLTSEVYKLGDLEELLSRVAFSLTSVIGIKVETKFDKK